jgi:pyruvate dehydrogenase (quinone)
VSKIASELLVERLIDWGVDTVGAEACGGYARTVEHPGELESAVTEMLARRGPALLDQRVNPDEPPMPPKVTYEQANGFVQSFLKGQPRRVSIASTVFRDKLDQLRS